MELLSTGLAGGRATTGSGQIIQQQQRAFARLPEDFEKYYRKEVLRPKGLASKPPAAVESQPAAAAASEQSSTSGRAATSPADVQQMGAEAGETPVVSG